MARSQSIDCALPSCTRMVRYDNPTFPYCRDHQSLKTARSSYQNISSAREMEQIRETLYNPERSEKKRMVSASEIMSESSPGLSVDESKMIVRSWVSNTRGLNMLSPEVAYSNRDELLSKMGAELAPHGSVEVLQCSQGMIINHDRGAIKTNDHEVLLYENDDGKFVVDPAAAAPLYGVIDKDVPDEFGSGTTTCGDGLYTSTLGEFGAYSSVEYQKITDSNGETVWSNEPDISQDENRMRELIARSPKIVFPKVEYKTRADDFYDKSTDVEDNLDEFLFDD